MARRRPGSPAGIELTESRGARKRRRVEAKGYRILRPARLEEWQQTTARLLSPEGLLVGIAYTPWMHAEEADAPED